MTKCNRCGWCCTNLVFTLKAQTKQDEKYLEGFDYRVVNAPKESYIITKKKCKYYDANDKLCTRYFDRPDTCKNYPKFKQHPFFELMDSDGVRCGYDPRGETK